RIQRLVVDGGGNDAVTNGECGGQRGDGASGAERVTDHAFVAAHRQAPGMLPKRGADRLRLCGVVERRARAVRHDVVDLSALEPGVSHGTNHRLSGTVAGRVRRADVEGVPGER